MLPGCGASAAVAHCCWADPSQSTNAPPQRLEFLGDAVLDALVTTHFYTAHRSVHSGCVGKPVRSVTCAAPRSQ